VRHIAGIAGPKKLPPRIFERVSREITAQLRRPNIKDQFERQSYPVRGSTPEEFAAAVRENIATWKRIVRDTGIPLE
jgi:tripartite-type tricarboxylate transporter receptor subunit TctC